MCWFKHASNQTVYTPWSSCCICAETIMVCYVTPWSTAGPNHGLPCYTMVTAGPKHGLPCYTMVTAGPKHGLPCYTMVTAGPKHGLPCYTMVTAGHKHGLPCYTMVIDETIVQIQTWSTMLKHGTVWPWLIMRQFNVDGLPWYTMALPLPKHGKPCPETMVDHC